MGRVRVKRTEERSRDEMNDLTTEESIDRQVYLIVQDFYQLFCAFEAVGKSETHDVDSDSRWRCRCVAIACPSVGEQDEGAVVGDVVIERRRPDR